MRIERRRRTEKEGQPKEGQKKKDRQRQKTETVYEPREIKEKGTIQESVRRTECPANAFVISCSKALTSVQNFVDEFLPEILVGGGRVVYTFETGIRFAEVTDDTECLTSRETTCCLRIVFDKERRNA